MAEKGRSAPEAQLQAAQGTQTLKDLWNAGTGDPRAFYRRPEVGVAYIDDLTSWHSAGSVDSWFTTVSKAIPAGSHVLDFGAGIGSYSLMLAACGCVVDACEPNGILRQYIQWRAERHGLAIRVVDRPGDGYDAVIAMDVVEHLADPGAFALNAAHWLDRGDPLVLTWTFHKSDGAHPMHAGPEHEAPFLRLLSSYFVRHDLVWPCCLRRR
jgi:2-polyprenyl-3-methyl-5-hydroxy-6-metoxy-1,4-benzoquinol methylase